MFRVFEKQYSIDLQQSSGIPLLAEKRPAAAITPSSLQACFVIANSLGDLLIF